MTTDDINKLEEQVIEHLRKHLDAGDMNSVQNYVSVLNSLEKLKKQIEEKQ